LQALLYCAFVALAASAAEPLTSAIRLDDHLATATIQASAAQGTATAAEPVIWQSFSAGHDSGWKAIRGALSFRNGDLLIQGGGSTPVLFSPKDAAIDWALYRAVEIRMSAEAGREVKIKIGDFEGKQKLGPARQYNVYRFPVEVDAPKGSRLLGVMPTDSLTAPVAIRSIRLIPKPANFAKPAGRISLGKQDEYRQTVYVHSPATLSFRVNVPRSAHLHFGLGTTAKGSPVAFSVSVQGSSTPLFSQSLNDPDRWQDADVDLSRFGGSMVVLELKTQAAAGTVGLWSSPLVTGSALPSRPNILIYIIDTLRADHASLYGYRRDTTPFLNKLGKSGIVFEDCQAPATWTKPSIASLMTSLNSFTHGIVRDADTIPAGATTIAEQLRVAGYVTASIVASPYAGRATGLERGFDHLLEFPVVAREHQPAERQTDSEALNGVVFPWLDRHHKEPFLLYAHSTDPHAPYDPPALFDHTFSKPSETAAFRRSYESLRGDHQYGGAAVVSHAIVSKAGIDPDRFITQAVDRYDEEILHNDRSLELLVGKLKQLGVLENTLIVVVSDHGEEFWEHGWTGHGQSVYQELTNCLFLLWNPALFKVARRVSEPVQLTDVMPTILDALRLQSPTVMQGQSVLPLAQGQKFQRRGLVVASRFAAPKAEGLVPENGTDSFAIVDSKWKFIFRNHAAGKDVKRVELYDRSSDRLEAHDVADRYPQEVELKMSALRQWIEAQDKIRAVIGHSGTSNLDSQTLRQMRSLGYLGGPSQ